MTDKTNETPITNHCRVSAEQLVANLFDLEVIDPRLTLESIKWLEDYIALIFQHRYDSTVKECEFTKSFKGATITKGKGNL